MELGRENAKFMAPRHDSAFLSPDIITPTVLIKFGLSIFASSLLLGDDSQSSDEKKDIELVKCYYRRIESNFNSFNCPKSS